MRFALIGPSAPLRGGIAQYHDQLAAALAARGDTVQRISFRRLYPGLLFPGRTQFVTETESAAARAAASPSDGRALAPPLPLLDSMRPSTWAAAADAVDADVAIVEWWHPFFAPALATVLDRLAARGVRSIVVCHNLEPHERFPGSAVLARRVFARADAFVTSSERDAGRLRDAHPGRPIAVVVPPPALPPPCPHADRAGCERALGLPAASRRALFFGYVRKYKGVTTLIAALPRTPDDLQLVIAGEIYHRDAAWYGVRAAAAGVAPRVVLLDRFVAAAEVSCCFRAADVVVLPYWQASQSAVAPLALAYGRAVVASAVGGIPEVVEPRVTGLLVPPRDPAALAAAITEALAHTDEWGTAAARVAARYSWDSAAESVAALATAISTTSTSC